MAVRRFCLQIGWVLALSVVVAASRAESAADGKGYIVKLERPSKVGEKADVSISATVAELTVITAKNREPEQSETHLVISVEGRGETLAIDSHGWETKAAIRLTKAQMTRDGKTSNILPPGTTLQLSLEGEKTVFKVDDKPVSDEAAEALAEVLFLHDPRTHNDDEVYMNNEPRTVGTTWPCNADLNAKDLSIMGLPVSKDHVSGSSTLLGVKTSDGEPCLHLQLEITADQIKPELPAGMTAGNTTMQMLLHVMVPVDTSSQYGKASLATRMVVTAARPAGKDSPAATIRRVIERGRSVTAKPVE